MANERFMTQAPAKPLFAPKTPETNAPYKLLTNAKISLVDRNEWLMLFLQRHIELGNYSILKATLQKAAESNEFDLSLLKAMLIMTEHVQQVRKMREKLAEVLQRRLNGR